MFQVGENVVYGQCGVCRVLHVGPLPNGSMGDRPYYTLQPYYSTEVIYAPVEGKVFMRPALDRARAEEVIRAIPDVQREIEAERNLTVMREKYEAAFRSYNCEDLIGLIKNLYQKNQDAVQNGRRVGQLDLRYMKRAEELLHGELAIALGIRRDEVAPYIEQILTQNKI